MVGAGRIELPTSTVSTQAGVVAPSGTESQGFVFAGQTRHSTRDNLHQIAPNDPVSHAAGYPVVTGSRGAMRVIEGGAGSLLTVRQVAVAFHG